MCWLVLSTAFLGGMCSGPHGSMCVSASGICGPQKIGYLSVTLGQELGASPVQGSVLLSSAASVS